MHPVFRLLIVMVALLAACVDAPGDSTTTVPRIVANRIVANRIVANRIVANKLLADKLVAGKLTSSVFGVNMTTAGELISTDDGREVFAAIVACALPDFITLEATVSGVTFDFSGDLGLVSSWLTMPLGPDDQRWISACLFARVNAHEVAIPISLRGPNPALAADPDERAAFTLEEGGFFGNYFTPKDQPIQWYACRGAGQARGENGDLAFRDCTEPDPDHPGLTQCGFTYAGDCGTFAAAHACELGADGGSFYRRCHTAPIGKVPFPNQVFLQVITTFVMP